MKRLVALCLAFLLQLPSSPARAEGDRLTLYPAYSDGHVLQVEGRIVERRAVTPPTGSDGRLDNLWRSARQFFNDERQQRAIRLRLADFHAEVRSDGEGYFRFAQAVALSPGWQRIEADSDRTAARGQVLVVPPENRLGLISDLDDTILVSEVTRKHRLLANTFLKNPAQRQAVPGMAALYARVMAQNVRPAAAPLFYLSASPRQMHDGIAEFLERNAFPPGVLITKRVTNDASGDPLLDQFAYKTRRIEEILTRLPWVRFVLVGDDGERDPEIYDWVRQHYPERVAAIWIHHVSPDPQRHRPAGQRDLAEVLAETPELRNAALPTRPSSLPSPQGNQP